MTPLQSFENGQALILVVFHSFLRLILSLSFLCSSVYEALFALIFSFLIERFSSAHAKAALAYIIRVSLVGFYHPILTLSMHAFGPRNSAYAFWTTTDTHIYIYHAKSRLNTAMWGSLRSPNYSPVCHTHYLTLDQYFTSLCRRDPLPSRELETNTCCSVLLQNLVGNSALRKLNNKQRQVSMFLILLFKLLTQFPFLSISILSLLPFSFCSPSHPSLLSLLINSLSS